jgi:hypothetical protein
MSTRSGGGGKGERRLYTPEREVGGLQIFRLFLLGQSFMMTEDGLSLSLSSIATAKTLEPCISVGHVKADLEKNKPQPPTWRAKCQWISCHKNAGYHAIDPRIRTQGAEHVRSWIATKHGDGSLECRTRYALQRERPSFTEVQGPHGEVKPLLPAFLYCNVTPREEYKALVTKL